MTLTASDGMTNPTVSSGSSSSVSPTMMKRSTDVALNGVAGDRSKDTHVAPGVDDEATLNFIRRSLRGSLLISSLLGDEKHDGGETMARGNDNDSLPPLSPAASHALNLLARSAEPLVIAPQQVLIRQGQRQCDHMYVIEDGELDVFVEQGPASIPVSSTPASFPSISSFSPSTSTSPSSSSLSSRVRVRRAHRGDVVGALPFAYSIPRACTIVNNSNREVHAFAIPRTAFDRMIREDEERRKAEVASQQSGMFLSSSSLPSDTPSISSRLQHRRFLHDTLGSIPLFKHVDDELLREQLLSQFIQRLYKQGEVIIHQGDQGDSFYILEEGRAQVEVVPINSDKLIEEHAMHPEHNDAQNAAPDEPPVPRAWWRSWWRWGWNQQPEEAQTQDYGGGQAHASESRESGHPNTSADDQPICVDIVEPGKSFGELALLYNVRRSATVRCTAPSCRVWSIDAATFLAHTKRGSRLLFHIFRSFASVQLHEDDGAVPASSPTSTSAHAPSTHGRTRYFMTERDFLAAVRYTRGIGMWSEHSVEDEQQQADKEDSFFQKQVAQLKKKHEMRMRHQKHEAETDAILNPRRLKLIFRLADTSGDNLLSFAEFLLLHSLLSQPHSEMQLAFRLFDKDKNGVIDRQEFIAAIKALAADRGDRIDFDHDPLIHELFDDDHAQVKGDSTLASAAASSLAASTQSAIATPTQPPIGNGAEASRGGVKHHLMSLFHSKPSSSSPPPDSKQSHVDHAIDEHAPPVAIQASSANAELSNTSVSDTGRTLTYEQFALLLKRDKLPVYLQEMKRDLRAIDRYWSRSDMPFSLSTIEDGYGISLNLEHHDGAATASSTAHLAAENLPTPASATVTNIVRMPWKNLLAGGVAGAISRCIVAPLERIKMLFQLQGRGMKQRYVSLPQTFRLIHKEDGWRGFFKGNGSNILRASTTIALQFFFFDIYHRLILTAKRKLTHPPTVEGLAEMGEVYHDPEAMTVGTRLLAGATAGMTACVIAYPLDIVRARLTWQSGAWEGGLKGYSGIRQAFRSIYRTEGVKGFYHGLVPSLAAVVPYLGLDFAIYESLKTQLPRDEYGQCSRVHLLCCGGMAGLVGQSIAFPLDVVRRRMQVYGWSGSGVDPAQYSYLQGTFMDALRIIYKEEGIRGLYRGCGVNIIKVVPAVSVAFVLYENLRAKLDDD